MDYLTNYYKNLCEERQQQIKVLEENLLRRGLYGLGNIIGAGFNTFDKAKSGIGGMAAEIGKGIVGGGQALSDWGGEKQEEAQQSLERSRQLDPRRIQHEKAIVGWMRGGGNYENPNSTNITRVLEDASKYVDNIRSHTRWSASIEAREKHPTKEPKQRKKPYTADEFAKLDDDNNKINQKRQKIADAAVADFDKKHSANLALSFIAGELSKQSGQINADEPFRGKTYHPITGEREDLSGREQHSGGHHVGRIRADPYGQRLNPKEHSDVAAYRKWYEDSGHRIQDAIHPDELFGHHTAHVDEAFETHIPDYGLRAANQRNKKAFDSAVQQSRQLMAIPDPFAGQISASGGLKTATLRPAFESYSGSRNKFLKDKINKLIESKDNSDDRIDIRKRIDKVVGSGLQRITHLHKHPNATIDHRTSLDNLDEYLLSLSDGARASDASIEDLQGMHSDAHNAMTDIQAIEDSLH